MRRSFGHRRDGRGEEVFRAKRYPPLLRCIQQNLLAVGGDQAASAPPLLRISPAMDAGFIPPDHLGNGPEATADRDNSLCRVHHA